MNREQIDDVFRLVKDDKMPEVLKKYMEITEEEFYEMSDEKLDEMLRKFMKNIEDGDYEYFKSRINNPEYIEIVADMMSYASDDKQEDKIDLVENTKKYGLDSYYIVELIKSINKPDFTKKCIEKREEYGLKSNDIVELIESINEPDFTKKCIRKREEYGVSSYYAVKWIKSINDPVFTKECIEKREEYGLVFYKIRSFIESIKDSVFTEECIKKREEYGLSSNDVVSLITSIKDSAFTEECIKKREEYGLSSNDVVSLITSIKDPALTEECIKKREEYGLSSNDVVSLIKSIKDSDFTEEFIEKREEYGLSSDDVVSLIKSIKDPVFTKKCIKKREEYGLSSYNVAYLIKASNDFKFILSCLTSDYKELMFDENHIFKICDKIPEVLLENFHTIAETYVDEEYYGEFIKRYLGEVELDRSKKPIIPKDLETIIFKPITINMEMPFSVKDILPEVIAKWDQIKEQIQYKKANAIKDNSLEVRISINEILEALKVLNRRVPKNISEEEFEKTPGSEKVGQDPKYTSKPETAVERAHELARKMDEAGRIKKYPDFSVEDHDIILRVLHPQDKSAILLGYDANCCFRPNGNADEKAQKKESLLQYCTTTAYGGVLRVESKSENKVYMGTPFLINGNCLMFHSYETLNGNKCEEVNKLLVESAKKAICESKGNIRAVFMTNLHEGAGRLNVSNKVNIGSFFRAYTDEEYREYRGMYTNLECENIVLAIEVNGQILTGEEVEKWFEEECNSDKEIFKQKLGLKLGKVEESYEFPRKNDFQEIIIDNPKLVSKFYNRYRDLKQERTVLALLNKKNKIENKGTRDSEDEKTLKVIEEELKQYDEAIKYLGLSEKEIKKRLEENREEIFRIFSGDDIRLIAESYGISEEDIEKAIVERIEASANRLGAENQEQNKQESSKTRRVRNKLIAQIKGMNNSELIKLISKVARDTITEEELEKLKNAEIDIAEYERLCIKKEGNIDLAKAQEDRRRGQIERAKKDKTIIESIIAEKIFANVTEEEIDNQILRDLIKTIKSEVYEYYVALNTEGMISELEKEEINNKIHQLNLDNAIPEIISGNFEEENISFESLEIISKLADTYKINLKAKYQDISANRGKIKKKVQKEKLEQLKSDVTIGIRKKEKCQLHRNSIMQGQAGTEEINFERMVIGIRWFIGITEKDPVIYVAEDIGEDERKDLKIALKAEIERQKSTAKKQTGTISMQEMKRAVSDVPIQDKSEAIRIMEELLSELEK